MRKLTVMFFLAMLFSLMMMASVSAVDCENYGNQSTCIADADCTWQSDDWGSWCDQKGCWNYQTNASCEGNGDGFSCQWHEDQWGSWCEEVGCWSFNQDNNTCINTGSAAVGKDCNWIEPSGETGWCEQPGCGLFGFTNETACTNNSAGLDCEWDTQGEYCYFGNDCWSQNTAPDCAAASSSSGRGCAWNNASSYCYETNCHDNDGTNVTACEAMEGCNWNDPWCEEFGCWNYNDPGSCGSNSCYWKNQTGQGWCEQAQCWQYDNISLSGAATELGCINNTAGLNCSWDNPAGPDAWCWENFDQNCSTFTNERDCMDTFFCFWDFGNKSCKDPGDVGQQGFFEATNPGCWIFNNQTECEKVIDCNWNAGTSSCEGNPDGINCTLINDSTMCGSIPMLSTCCDWQGSGNGCVETFSSACWDDMEEPPEGAAFCEDYNAYDSQTLCNQIAGLPWYMPCRWDNESDHCAFKADDFFGVGETAKLIEIDNKQNCEAAGGSWILDMYCEGTIAISAGHCEPKFDQERNCNKACYACEYKNDGTAYATQSAAETACENSERGCQFETDATAPNGYGFCDPNDVFKNSATGKCEDDCAGCTYVPNPQSACENSDASCKWDPTTQICVKKAEKTCENACDRCYEESSCTNYGRGSPGACNWNSGSSICQPVSGSVEVCWDGVDNDDNDLVDCADSQCYSDPFCGGDLLGSDCFVYTTNSTCEAAAGCAWLEDSWGGWCDFEGATCWNNDGDQAGCEAKNESCQWQGAYGGGECDFNWDIGEECWNIGPNATACNASANCTWVNQQWGGYCEHNDLLGGQNCVQYDGDQASCEEHNDSCSWFNDEYGPGYCDPIMTQQCMNLNSSNCIGNSVCQWSSGWCDPIGFNSGQDKGSTGGGSGGGLMCWLYNGRQNQCLNLTGCSYFQDPMGYHCDIDKIECWNLNSSDCIAQPNCTYQTEPWSECYSAFEDCFRNMTLNMNQTACNNDPHCTWNYGHCGSTFNNETTQPGCEGAGGLWSDGMCNDAQDVQGFAGMESGAPTPLGMDPPTDSLCDPYTEMFGFGLKDMGDTYGFGAQVDLLEDSAICNGQYMQNGQQGVGTDTTTFIVYLDSDGARTGNCALRHDSGSAGYEFMFKYKASYVNSVVSESYTAYRCSSGSWTPADIGLSAFRMKMCQELGGPMLAVDKNDLMKFPSLYDPTKDMGVVVSTVANGTNATSPCDVAGVGWYSPGAVDFTIGDMFSYDGDTEGYEDLMKQGFVAYEDCWNKVDDDKDGLVDCDDFDCTYAKVCENTGVNAPGFVDTSSPKVAGVKIENYPDGALIMYDTNKPANGTILFYGNDSTCGTLNDTVPDVGILKAGVREFKSWHAGYLDAETLGGPLDPATRYYYKLEICDNNGKCATSKCSDVKTSPADSCKYCNFVTRIKVPPGWYVTYDVAQNGTEHVQGQVCGANAGMKTNYTDGKHVDMYLYDTLTRNDSDAYGITFQNATLTKTSLNQKVRDVDGTGSIKSGTQSGVPYTGMPRETRDKIINNLHPEVCMVQFPKPAGGCTELWHCDDDITSCEQRTDAVLVNDTDYCLWQVPFCEFSVWAGGDATGGDSGGNGNGNGGGGGGGGVPDLGGTVYSLTIVSAGQEIIARFAEIAVARIATTFTAAVASAQLAVGELLDVPTGLDAPPVDHVYLYTEVSETNFAGNTEPFDITFRIPHSWLSENALANSDVKIFHYENDAWKAYPATVTDDDALLLYDVTVPTLGFFSIGGSSSAAAPVETGESGDLITGEVANEGPTGHVVDVPTASDDGSATDITQEEKGGGMMAIWLILLGVAVVVIIVSMMVTKKD